MNKTAVFRTEFYFEMGYRAGHGSHILECQWCAGG